MPQTTYSCGHVIGNGDLSQQYQSSSSCPECLSAIYKAKAWGNFAKTIRAATSPEKDNALSKPDFLRIIAELQEAEALAGKVNKLFRDSPLNTDFCNASGMAIYHDGLVVELLDRLMDSGELISWWVYERDFGREKNTCTRDEDNNKIDLDTAEKLYDYLSDA